MGATTEVRLDFISHAKEPDAATSFMAWLHAQPELPEVLSVWADDLDPEGSSLVITVRVGSGLLSLAAALVAWMSTRRTDITIKLSTVEVPSGAEAASFDLFLRSLVSSASLIDAEGNASWKVIGEFRAGFRADLSRVIVDASSLPDPGESRRPRDLAEYVLLLPDEPDEASASTMPITIYLSDEGIHQQVEAALEALLDVAGLQIESRDDPVFGSWFRRMRASVKAARSSPAAREATLVAAHVADTRLVLAQDAAVTAALLQNLGPVLGALQPTKDAVIRAGALLIVKVDWVVNVYQLTAAQQAVLDHRPRLSRSPHEIVAALNLVPEDSQGKRPPALE